MLGNVKIYFGKIASVTDELKLCRAQIIVDGYTEENDPTLLPWYFPWYGLNYLPVVEDVVPVLVFDDNFSTAFYGRKVDLVDAGLADDYENYLEIFKRTISDNDVKLTYTVSKGIEFINGDGKVQIELDKTTLFSKANSIEITEDKIKIGNDAKQMALLGDDTVTELQAIIKHQKATIDAMMQLFDLVSTACVTPFTVPIKAALTAGMPALKISLGLENSQVKTKADQIQSKKVSIE